MKGIILAGGYATRLQPLTFTQPKHLLPIGEKPMIDYLMEKLKDLPVDEWFLVTNDKFAHNFEEWNRDEKWNITIVNDGTKEDGDRLGSLGDIKFVVDKFNIEDDLFIAGADNLTDFDFDALLAKFDAHKKPVLGAYDIGEKEFAKQCGVVSVDIEGEITSFVEKPQEPQSTLISTLFYVLPHSAMESVTLCCETGRFDKAGFLIEELLNKGSVYAVPHDGFWFDIGTPKTYEDAQIFFKQQNE